MLKITPSLKNDGSSSEKDLNNHPNALQPSASTLAKIMQFATSYRVEKIEGDQFIELFLN